MEYLDDLREVMTCVVCLDTLSPLAIQCQRGHALCKECQNDQRICPSCRKPFLRDKPTLLCQIAAIVAGQCKFRGCTYIRQFKEDDHQVWCGFRPTNCKLCNWTGYGKDMYSHAQDNHHALSLVSSESKNLAQRLGHYIRSRQLYVPFSALGFFFWLQLKNLSLDWENQHSLLAVRIKLVPSGKINHDLYFNVGLKSKGSVYNVREKIQILPSEDSHVANCVFIPGINFMEEGSVLRMSVVKDITHSTEEKVNSYTHYRFNQVFDIYKTFKRYLDVIKEIYSFEQILGVCRTLVRHFEEITGIDMIVFILVIVISFCALFYKTLQLEKIFPKY